ncbi:MAG: monovalent cation:proton antiporter-2 (CPA2) family protein [Bacteroidales bacterium]|nr:monovalent cation:proton antiporter-2 (CPA2) family protein [Bacteroidales bacterium]MCF8403578.1 monovalent cation:proton antiporter-2 (CPA2) family protein [Bacteroidales bacterium]
MHEQTFFYQALIFLSAAVISVPIAKRLGFGSVLGYLLAGIFIGPYILKLVGNEGEDIMHFAEFGVVMMLFLIGLELKPSLLWKMRRSIFGLGGLQVVLSVLVIGTIAYFLGLNIYQSVSVGLILSLSSTAIVLQTLAEKGLLKTQGGQGSFSVLLFQDIAVIPILAILPLMANQVDLGLASDLIHADTGHEAGGVASLPGWQQVLIIIGVVAVIIGSGRYLARYLFRFIATTGLREIFTAAALLLVIGIAVAMDAVGLSPALGTFLAGVVLADNEYRHELESDIEPFKGLLLGLFFIAVGASIDFHILFDSPGTILGIVATLMAVKFFILYFLGKRFGLKSGQEMLTAFALAQAGEFAFVLISFSTQNAIFDSETSGMLLIIVALSMLLTPLLLILNEKVIQPFYEKTANKEKVYDVEEKDNPVIIAGFGRFGVVLGRFLKANGIQTTILDDNPNNIQVLRKFGIKVYYGDATRPDLVEIAGAGRAKVLVVAMEQREMINELVAHVKMKYPNLKVFARAVDIRHSFELEDLKVESKRMEIYDSAIDLGMKAMIELGYNNYQAHRLAKTFKHHDEMVMKELHKLWKDDDTKYITEARKFSEQLENILLTEQQQPIHDADHAWDSTTIREEIQEIYGKIKEKE